MYPRIWVPPTSLALQSIPPWGNREFVQIAYDQDPGDIFVREDFVYANSRKAAAAMYLGIPLIQVVCIPGDPL